MSKELNKIIRVFESEIRYLVNKLGKTPASNKGQRLTHLYDIYNLTYSGLETLMLFCESRISVGKRILDTQKNVRLLHSKVSLFKNKYPNVSGIKKLINKYNDEAKINHMFKYIELLNNAKSSLATHLKILDNQINVKFFEKVTSKNMKNYNNHGAIDVD